jgi:hypothetical protein
MSLWSSGLTVCFPPQGAAVCAPGMQPTPWNWHYLLALSRYIGDPDVIPDHWLRLVLFACGFRGDLRHSLVPVPFSLQATDYGDIPLGSRKANTHYWGGGALWSSCISHTFTMSHWSSGLTICFLPQGAVVHAPGVQPTPMNCLLGSSASD